MQVPVVRPRLRRKSKGVVPNVTSDVAVPWLGLRATTFSVKRGVARFVLSVIFFRLLLIPQMSVLDWSVVLIIF